MTSIDLTAVVLAVIGMVNGWGWVTNRRKYKQEVKNMEAENLQKYMDLAKEYVEEFRKNIGEPLQQEVGELRKEVKQLKYAVQRINDCTHRSDCPVRVELMRDEPSGNED